MTFEELMSILLTIKPSEHIKKEEEAIFEFIPELKKCKGFDQHSKWHIYDVYEHILHVVDDVPNNSIMRLAALFHDLGKPDTFIIDSEGRGHFPKHNEVSLKIFQDFVNRSLLDKHYSKEIIDVVSKIIYYHDLDFSKDTEEVIKAIDDIGFYYIVLLFRFKESDLKAQNPEFHYILSDYQKQLEHVMELDESKKVDKYVYKKYKIK